MFCFVLSLLSRSRCCLFKGSCCCLMVCFVLIFSLICFAVVYCSGNSTHHHVSWSIARFHLLPGSLLLGMMSGLVVCFCLDPFSYVFQCLLFKEVSSFSCKLVHCPFSFHLQVFLTLDDNLKSIFVRKRTPKTFFVGISCHSPSRSELDAVLSVM